MPFIHVKSLPFAEERNIPVILEGLCADFADKTGIDLKYVTATWEFYAPGHYAVAGRSADTQPEGSHPVLVDLLLPDFNEKAAIEGYLHAAADSVAAHAEVAKDNIFVNARLARSGHVFDVGEIVRW
jgi:hypothetical protein